MPRIRRSAPLILGLLAILVAAQSAQPQGNIDAGKTPAQMFSDTCATCHRRPQELKRGASAGFLRQHYMSGAQEAAAMAAYLASVPGDPRAGKDRGKDKQEKAKLQQQAQEKTKQPPPKGKRPPDLSKAPADAPEPPQEPGQRAEAPPVPKLEPFEE